MRTGTVIAAALIGGVSASSNGGRDGSAIYWTATGMQERYVLDVNGFEDTVPKQVMLWRRDGSTPNSNEYFKYIDDTVMWQTGDGTEWLCLEADFEKVQMNWCNGGSKQKWKLKGTTTTQANSFKLELASYPGHCIGIKDNKGANSQRVQMTDCNNDSQISFVAAGWKAPPSPPSPQGKPCDGARFNECYSKFHCGGGEFQCRCVNGPGTDPSKFTWYQWVCGQGSSVAFMDSKCQKCNGLSKNGHVQPCPCRYSNGNVTIAV